MEDRPFDPAAARRAAIRADVEALTPPGVPVQEREPPAGGDADAYFEMMLALLQARQPRDNIAYFSLRDAAIARLDEAQFRRVWASSSRRTEMQIAAASREIVEGHGLRDRAALPEASCDEQMSQLITYAMLRNLRRDYRDAIRDSIDTSERLHNTCKIDWSRPVPIDHPLLRERRRSWSPPDIPERDLRAIPADEWKIEPRALTSVPTTPDLTVSFSEKVSDD